MKLSFSVFFSIYFFIGSFFPQVDFEQLTHIPEAIAHFKKHKTEARLQGERCTILTFLESHYLIPNGHHHDGEDPHEHDGLPLMHLHETILLVPAEVHRLPITSPEAPTWQEIGFYTALDAGDFRLDIDRPPSLTC